MQKHDERLTPSTNKKHQLFHLASQTEFFGEKITGKPGPFYYLLRACDVLLFLEEKYPASFTRQELDPIITSFGYAALGMGDNMNNPSDTSPTPILGEYIERKNMKYTVSKKFLANQGDIVIRYLKKGHDNEVFINLSKIKQAILSDKMSADQNDFTLDNGQKAKTKKSTASKNPKKADSKTDSGSDKEKEELKKQIEDLQKQMAKINVGSQQPSITTVTVNPNGYPQPQFVQPIQYGYPQTQYVQPVQYGYPQPQLVQPVQAYGYPQPPLVQPVQYGYPQPQFVLPVQQYGYPQTPNIQPGPIVYSQPNNTTPPQSPQTSTASNNPNNVFTSVFGSPTASPQKVSQSPVLQSQTNNETTLALTTSQEDAQQEVKKRKPNNS